MLLGVSKYITYWEKQTKRNCAATSPLLSVTSFSDCEKPPHASANLVCIFLPLLIVLSPSSPYPAVTAYSPAVVALQNLVCSQLSLTRHLVSQSQHLAGSIITSATPDHQYTTLQSTKDVSDGKWSCECWHCHSPFVFCSVHQ